MGMTAIIRRRESDGDDYRDYKKALKVAKKSLKMAQEAIETICELTEDMEEEYGERSVSEERDDEMEYRSGAPVISEREWKELQERRRRSHMRKNM